MRLFWRILGGYFLAWLLLSLAVVGTFALDSRVRFLPRSAVSQTLPAAVSVQVAAGNLSVGGEEVLGRMAKRWGRGTPPYMVDLQGRELLGREVDLEVLELARSLASQTVEPAPVKRVKSPEGREFVIYHPESTGPGDDSPFRWFLEYPWLLGIVFAVAGLVLAGGLTAAWTRPIAGLKAAIDAFAKEQLEGDVAAALTGRRDEIGDLARHFNNMTGRLRKSVSAQRQLLHDVSHEIRSPLARLSVAADLARRRPERIEEALDRIERESKRLDRLVGEVLTLARIEGDAAPQLDDYFDLIELVRVIRDDVEFEANVVGVEVTLEVSEQPELVIRGNAELLHRAIENVVRNALQHAEGTARIEIRVEVPPSQEEGQVLVRVRDHGQEVAEKPGALFEPFAKDSGSDGFGLGLAIARRAVEVHGGSIRAERPTGEGIEIQILLPTEPLRDSDRT